ncbi:MAG: hypothetical protein MK060_01685 [Blastomonas sp.]|uniref:hypothetical protein n=1 Tax=Blastomonas sp. TaxID=1909299 RepID=UPI00406A4FF3|nr:hypothetical protein [Blastomonas sp.]
MFEAELFGAAVNVTHLIPVVVTLPVITTYLLVRVTRLKAITSSAVSVLITQILARFLWLLIRSETAQPVHGAKLGRASTHQF